MNKNLLWYSQDNRLFQIGQVKLYWNDFHDEEMQPYFIKGSEDAFISL